MPAADLPVAVAYFRMSSDKQDMSIADQKAKVAPWVADKYRVVEEYVDEGKSGSKDTGKRLAFLRMVSDLTEGKYAGTVRYVVSVDKSRFDRLDTLDGAEFKKRLRDARVRFDSPINGLIDWSTPIGRMMDTLLSEANHQAPLVIAEKGLQGRIRVTREGRPNQTTPYGMAKKLTTPAGEKVIVPRGQRWATPKAWGSEFCPGDPHQAEALRFAFTTFAGEDISYNELARRMQSQDFPPPGSAEEWHGETLRWMLQNPVYAGGLRIGKAPKGRFFRTSNGKETAAADAAKGEPVVVWDCHEGIVGRDLWDRVQVKIRRGFKARGKARRQGPYALTGVVICGSCGRPMYASKDAQGAVMYRCHRAEGGGRAPCGYWIAWERDILPYLTGEFLAHVRRQLTVADATQPSPDFDADPLRDELKRLDARLSQARERFLEAPPDVAKGLLPTLEKWDAERLALAEKIAATPGPDADRYARLAEWWTRHLREFFASNPVELATSTEEAAAGWEAAIFPTPVQGFLAADADASGFRYEARRGKPGVIVPAAKLREGLKAINTKVSVWFKRKLKGRGYDIDKVRVQADLGPLCNGEASNAAS
jgi:DNA invertase Pin-like site-specific DNA recombinase